MTSSLVVRLFISKLFFCQRLSTPQKNMQSFFANEIASNSFLSKLQDEEELLHDIIRSNLSIFLPQNVSLAEIDLTPTFMKLHLGLVNPKNTTQFISMGGIHGIFSADRQMVHVIAVPKKYQNSLSSSKLGSLFSEAQVLFQNSPPTRDPIIVLREGSTSLRGKSISIVLLSEPLYIPEVVVLQPQQQQPTTSSTPPSNSFFSDLTSRIPFTSSSSSTASSSPTQSSSQPQSSSSPSSSRPLLDSSQSLPGVRILEHLTSSSNRNSVTIPTSNEKRHRRTNSTGQKTSLSETAAPTPLPNKSSKFIQLVNRPQAKEIADAIRKFLKKFLQAPPSPSKYQEVIQHFLKITEHQISIHPLWGAEKEDFDSTQDALEKLVTSKLFQHIFCPTEEDKEKDAVLQAKLARLNRFIEPKNLDLRGCFVKEDHLARAMKELSKINDFKSPRDKMVCIMNCCKVIYDMLNSVTSDENRDAAGADDFFPALLYAMIRGNVPRIYSNAQYIRKYRHPSKLMTETGYYFTHFESAVRFIQESDHTRFGVDETVWSQYMGDASTNKITDFSTFHDPSLLLVGDIPALLSAYHALRVENARLQKEMDELKSGKSVSSNSSAPQTPNDMLSLLSPPTSNAPPPTVGQVDLLA